MKFVMTAALGIALLAWTIASVGNRYLIGLRAVECRTGDRLASTQAEAKSRDDVLKALDEAGKRLRLAFGPVAGTLAAELEEPAGHFIHMTMIEPDCRKPDRPCLWLCHSLIP